MRTHSSQFAGRSGLFFLALVAALGCAIFLAGGTGVQSAGAGEGESPEGASADADADAGDAPPVDIFEGATTFSKEQADKAINAGIAWLSKKQGTDGSWGPIQGDAFYGGGQDDGSTRGYEHPAGSTAFAIYALLKSGLPENHPTIRKGFKYIKDNRLDEPRGAYETAALLLAVAATANPYKTSRAMDKAGDDRLVLKSAYKGWAQKLVDLLAEQRFPGCKGWRYFVNSTPGHGGGEDLSSTQLAALAFFAASRSGVRPKKVKESDLWEDILQFSMAQQEASGPEVEILDPANRTGPKYKAQARGFAYVLTDPEPQHSKPYGSMTACGLANIEMARYMLKSGRGGAEKWEARKDKDAVQRSLYDGLGWLSANWSSLINPQPGAGDGTNNYHIYYQYAVERAMDLFALQQIDTHHWYSEMGQELINRQFPEGYWNTESTHKPKDVLDTCFALLFLKRATVGGIAFPSFTGGSGPAQDNR